jgi:hypothetical protein
MCSISVEPMPSRISTPSSSVQRLPMSAGKRLAGGGAYAQRRAFRRELEHLRAGQQCAGIKRRHAVENGRLVLAQALKHSLRRRPFAHQHRAVAPTASGNVRPLPRP